MATIASSQDALENNNSSVSLSIGLETTDYWEVKSDDYLADSGILTVSYDTNNTINDKGEGVFTVVQVSVNDQESYSDFIRFNYGSLHERLHQTCSRKVNSRYQDL